MNVLFLCHRIPYPPNKGDKIRSFNEIKYLSESHDIDLACLADNPNDLKHNVDLEKHCRRVHVEPLNVHIAKVRGMGNLLPGNSISTGYFYNKKLQKVVDNWVKEIPYDTIFCFSSPMAEYVFRCKHPGILASRPPHLVMDFCDVDSDKWRQYSRSARFPMNMVYNLEFKRLLAFEKKVNTTFDHSIFVSKKEANLFEELAPHARNMTIIPNGVDFEYFSPDAVPPTSGLGPQTSGSCSTLMFAGAMDYNANIDGVTWFCKEIFPGLIRTHERIRFNIVGSSPAPSVKALANDNGVNVTGFVKDIRPYYSEADLCVIPLRLARGVQNKVLEAMAMGKAIVTTSAAVQGISAIDDEHLIIADTPSGFISAIDRLLADHEKRNQLGSSARNLVKKSFNWRNNIKKMSELLSF